MKSSQTLIHQGFRLLRVLITVPAIALPVAAHSQPANPPVAEYVIHISVDGLRPDAVTTLGPKEAPNFYRLRTEGAFTDNARTDYTHTTTVPNHTTQITGRYVSGVDGHGWGENATIPPEFTIHENKGAYVTSVFDAVHDHGRRTMAAIAKPKLKIFPMSYGKAHGGADKIGEDNGPLKIDRLLYISGAPELTSAVLAELKTRPASYSFVHFREPDHAGHASGWSLESGSAYLESVKAVDAALGRVLQAVEENPKLAGKTTLILTADHGGLLGTKGHDAPADPQAYTIPFYVWGAGVRPGDLYAFNANDRMDPKASRPDPAASPQPIRNGAAPNLALDLLGLPAIPGSTINPGQDLDIAPQL